MVSSQNINEEADRDSANWEEVIGARFKPTDWVLTGYYLAGKLSGRTDGPIFPYIKEVDVYQHEPSKLPSIAHDFGDGNMYFFSPVHMKYRKGEIIRRRAGDGCWKKSQKPSYVTGKDGVRIGIKTSLAYHKNDTKSGKPTIKTQWLMKEFMLLQDQQPKLTICVVYYHDKKRKQCDCELEGFGAAAVTENENLTMPTCNINPDIPWKRQRHLSNYNIPPSPEATTTLEQSLPSDPNSWAPYNPYPPLDSTIHFSPNSYQIPNYNNSLCSISSPEQALLPSDPNQNMMNGSWGAPTPNYNPPLYSSSIPVAATTVEQPHPFGLRNMTNGSLVDPDPNYNPPLYSSNHAAATFEHAWFPSDPNRDMANMMYGTWSDPADTNVYTPNFSDESLYQFFSESPKA